MEYLLVIIGGYIIGSIPFGLILTKLGGYGDIRDIGSGNIGATNVLRTGNKKLALATLVLDALKGAIAVGLTYYVASNFSPKADMQICALVEGCYDALDIDTLMMTAAFCALIGHLFPVWLKFKGGKGVATTLGLLLALTPLIGVSACGLWLLTAIVTRYSSLSALIAIAAAPALAYFLYGDANLTGMYGIVATLVFFKHRANIRRLINREESKIGQKK